MSYYHSQKINDKYILTYHAKRRMKERFFTNRDISETDLLLFLESLLENVTLLEECPDSGDIKLINYESNIEIVVTSKNVIKTIIQK